MPAPSALPSQASSGADGARAAQRLRPAAPALSFPPELLLRAQGSGLGIKAAIFDVDGVLTDGRLYIDEHGEQMKAFHVLDGHGLKLLAQAGIEPVILSGRDSRALRRRVADLGLKRAYYGAPDKLLVADQLCLELGMGFGELAAIGDDWPDLPLLERVGFACAPPDAHAEARALAHHVTTARGGAGAAREFCDILLMACGRYAALLDSTRRTLDAR